MIYHNNNHTIIDNQIRIEIIIYNDHYYHKDDYDDLVEC